MRRRVALIIETSSSYGRALLAGVTRYMRTHEEWSVFLEQRDLVREVPPWLAGWSGDGILSRITTPELVETVRAAGVPLVDLTDRFPGAGAPLVRSDDGAVGRLAARHLVQRGFRQFGFCGFAGEAWSERRETAFAAAARAAGGPCPAFRSPWFGPEAADWEADRRRLAAWIAGLPKPVGLMACNDVRGMQILDVCGESGAKVPEQVAVIGVDDDRSLCLLCDPPLSSVVPDAEAVGHLAAETLAALMNGLDPGPLTRTVPPTGVAARGSTNVVAIEEPEVAAALHYIRRHACRGITVSDVLREVIVSRSTLERKLRHYIGRSPQQEIRAVQIDKAKELLTTTPLPAEKIARLCGFKHPEYLHVVFKRTTGQTPGDYRAEESAPARRN